MILNFLGVFGLVLLFFIVCVLLFVFMFCFFVCLLVFFLCFLCVDVVWLLLLLFWNFGKFDENVCVVVLNVLFVCLCVFDFVIVNFVDDLMWIFVFVWVRCDVVCIIVVIRCVCGGIWCCKFIFKWLKMCWCCGLKINSLVDRCVCDVMCVNDVFGCVWKGVVWWMWGKIVWLNLSWVWMMVWLMMMDVW